MKKLEYRYRSQFGASLVEMALVISLIAVVGVANVSLFGNEVGKRFCDLAGSVETERYHDSGNENNETGTKWTQQERTCKRIACPPGWIETREGDNIECLQLPPPTLPGEW